MEKNMEQVTESVGKKVFALKSMVKEGDKVIQDGFLLFKNPEKAAEIINMCKKALDENPNSEKKMAFYEEHDWVSVGDFYATQVLQRGSMFVRNLSTATKGIVEE